MNQETIFKFVDAINRQDLPLIVEMMSEDFCFIDTYGCQEDKEHMKTGWKGYFDWFPDYHIEITDYVENDDFAVLLGTASASYLGKPDKNRIIKG